MKTFGKLTDAQDKFIETTVKQGAQLASRMSHRLIQLGILDSGNELTDLGREYATERGWLPNTSEPAAPAEAVSAFAAGDYVMFATEDGDTTGGTITSIVDGEYTVDEGNGVTYVTSLERINRKIDRTPKVSPFNVGDTVRYIGTNKKIKGLSGEVVSVDGTSSHVQFGNRPRSFNLGNSLLELVSRPQHANTHAATAGDGDSVKPTITAILRNGEVVPVIEYLGKGFVRVGGKYGGYSDVFITDFQMISDLMDAIIAERVREALAESEDAAQ